MKRSRSRHGDWPLPEGPIDFCGPQEGTICWANRSHKLSCRCRQSLRKCRRVSPTSSCLRNIQLGPAIWELCSSSCVFSEPTIGGGRSSVSDSWTEGYYASFPFSLHAHARKWGFRRGSKTWNGRGLVFELIETSYRRLANRDRGSPRA